MEKPSKKARPADDENRSPTEDLSDLSDSELGDESAELDEFEPSVADEFEHPPRVADEFEHPLPHQIDTGIAIDLASPAELSILFDKAILAIRDAVDRCREILSDAWLSNAPTISEDLMLICVKLTATYKATQVEKHVDELAATVRAVELGLLSARIRHEVVREYSVAATPAEEYERKKAEVRAFNETLRNHGAAIAHPKTGEPCILFAVPSRDGLGRYTLESRVSKTRTGFYAMLKQIEPLGFVDDVQRKEGVIERRKKLEG